MSVDAVQIEDPVVTARRAAQAEATRQMRAAYRHELDVAYGPAARQILDIYQPTEPAATPAPVLVFLHGGGFRGGAPGLAAGNGRAVLAGGAMFVAMGYRLVPELRFPESCADVELGLAWLREHLAERGGDPTRIYLAGHSAGAMLAATVGLRGSSAPVAGLVLISGMYDLTAHSAETVDPASPRYVPRLAEAIERVPARTILVGGDQDFPRVLPDARELCAAIQARGGAAELFVEPDADHFAANRGFVTPGSPVASAVGQMIGLRDAAD